MTPIDGLDRVENDLNFGNFPPAGRGQAQSPLGNRRFGFVNRDVQRGQSLTRMLAGRRVDQHTGHVQPAQRAKQLHTRPVAGCSGRQAAETGLAVCPRNAPVVVGRTIGEHSQRFTGCNGDRAGVGLILGQGGGKAARWEGRQVMGRSVAFCEYESFMVAN